MSIARLAARLDALAANLGRWDHRAQSARAAADKGMRRLRAQVRDLSGASAALRNRSADVLDHTQALATSTDTARRHAEQRLDDVGETRLRAMRLIDLVDNHGEVWRRRRHQAGEWVRRAERELAAAERELAAAGQRLDAAERDLSRAEAALSACRRDPNRRGCAREAARVHSAEMEVRGARAVVADAQERVARARADLAAANRRLACCEEAVLIISRAAGAAVETRAQAETAHQEATRSRDAADLAHTLATTQVERSQAAVGHAEQATMHSTAAERSGRSANTAHRRAVEDLQQARRHAAGGRRDLDRSATQLKRLARTRL